MTVSSTDPLSPSLLRSTFGAIGQHFVLPLAVLFVAVFTVHSVAVFGYEWQWALAKWGYPVLCVGALFALVWLKHWSVQSVLRAIVPLMLVASTAGYAYKKGLDANGGLYSTQASQWAETIAHAERDRDLYKGQRDEARSERDNFAAQVAQLQEQIDKAGKAPKAEEKRPVRAYRQKPAPSWFDGLLQ